MRQLTFYTNPQSRGVTVQWMLNECEATCDIRYETKIIEYDNIKSPDYLAINPMGKLPALVVKQDDASDTKSQGDMIITEAVAICAYLADTYPDANLAPTIDSLARGAYYRWLFWACNVLEPAMMVEFGVLTRDQSAETKQALGFGSFTEALAILDNELADKDYLCDGKFTTADLYLTSMLKWACMYKPDMALPENVASYLDRISKREAFPKPF